MKSFISNVSLIAQSAMPHHFIHGKFPLQGPWIENLYLLRGEKNFFLKGGKPNFAYMVGGESYLTLKSL